MYYLNNFLLFSIFGFFFETTLFTFLSIHSRSGFMYLWWTPFYGLGIVITLLFYHWIQKTNYKYKNIILFISLFVTLTILEFSGGILLEHLRGYYPWTYKNIPTHLGKYISIVTSLVWTLLSFFYIYVIKKISDKIINQIPKWLTFLISLIFLTDFILTLINLLIIKAN